MSHSSRATSRLLPTGTVYWRKSARNCVRMSETCASSGGESSNACGVRETFQRRNSLHSARRSSATASSFPENREGGTRVSLRGLHLQETDRVFRGEAGNVVSGAVAVLVGYPAHTPGKIIAACTRQHGPFVGQCETLAEMAECPVAFVAACGTKPDGDSGHLVVALRQWIVGECWWWLDSEWYRIGWLKCRHAVQSTRVACQPPGDGILK